ncbi:tRNA (adenosine(37)-N6)-threonylcarbamoyltransferase complex dimerization subunit type 1 TsaB [Rodentibacter genomosp. 1]|uniref:tRNA threonylcarbamoyladenosine biosynthesis protein TsaB n=1 Tax=Rodentibacter genomosp. 1 TaxID=1908264 RepID=A0A1V3J6B9_9PAST|nr:tRNA (adenosine(37)-N6)-threonylcarbamoyltransferase complex dimerization subunit type 1 TsaB [Rodentibacter genomosp. 1]OOF50599.1 tRNA (adenosine(37)-N6)-threonylcarbamoyltransferase complex dimerization subunit type 1 TsaB [Rodentibacter genomosp. 1]
MSHLTLLALDTSTEACSVALYYKGEKTEINELAQRSHTKRILPMVDEILAQSGIRLTQLDALAFGRGPGSFTGVRVGCSVAQGLALGADLPVLPISNLTAMAQAAFEQYQVENVAAAIDARMDEVYFCRLQRQKVRTNSGEFFDWQTIVAEQVCSPLRALEQMESGQDFLVGTGWRAYDVFQQQGKNGSEIELPRALSMLPLALNDWRQGKAVSALDIEPVYLRNTVAWKKLPGRE